MRIAVVGSGPRGLIVVERLAARCAEDWAEDGFGRQIDIDLIDAVEVGAGRVYRTDQPPWFLMNTVAGMVSVFSGVPDTGPTRAGAGPSLYEWWRTVDPDAASPDGYAARRDFGRYTRFLLDAVEANLPPGLRIRRVCAHVEDFAREGKGYRLTLDNGAELRADRVVLATGHSQPELSGWERDLADFAATHPGLRFLAGDSAADLPLDDLAPGAEVGVIGLGLAFYDVMAAATYGRGGRFEQIGADGALRYVPSGTEPVLVAGSRSGMPVHARGRNQKPPAYAYQPVLFTRDNIRRRVPSGPLDFRRDLLPWLRGEMAVVFAATTLRGRGEPEAAQRFLAEVAAYDGLPDVAAVAAAHGVTEPLPTDLDALAMPFTGREFADPAAFGAALADAVRADVAQADLGNVDSPFKAAMDVIRDCRGLIMRLADFSGFTPSSHRDGLIGWYSARSAFLAAGPPPRRLREVLALLECGLLRVVGPHARFEPDPATGRFAVSSPVVAGSRTHVDAVVDARIPPVDLERDLNPLTRKLRERGVLTAYVNATEDDEFRTGGVAVTTSPYHPIAADSTVDTGMYVSGIPTEHTRWFTQVGSNRPGLWGDFVYDADAIAAHLLKEDG